MGYHGVGGGGAEQRCTVYTVPHVSNTHTHTYNMIYIYSMCVYDDEDDDNDFRRVDVTSSAATPSALRAVFFLTAILADPLWWSRQEHHRSDYISFKGTAKRGSET